MRSSQCLFPSGITILNQQPFEIQGIQCCSKQFTQLCLTVYILCSVRISSVVHYPLYLLYNIQQVIKRDHDVTDDCFTELLTHWLSRTSTPPTWSVLIKAIKSKSIGYVDVADEIERKLATNVCVYMCMHDNQCIYDQTELHVGDCIMLGVYI